MQNKKGFTLLEMMIVLSLLSLFTLFVHQIQVHHQIEPFEQLKSYLLKAQNDANQQNRKMIVKINGDEVFIDHQYYIIEHLNAEMVTFHYNEFGNISKACTIKSKSTQTSMVLQLGSGNLEIRK